MFRLVAISVFFFVATLAQQIPTDLQGGTQTNAGIQARLNQKAVEQMRDLFGRILEAEIPNLNVPETSVPLPLQAGSAKIQNIKITSYRPPSTYKMNLQSPSTAVWISENFDFSTEASFQSQFQQLFTFLQSSGTIKAQAQGATLNVYSKLGRDPQGYPSLSVQKCDVTFNSLNVDVQADGFIGGVIDMLKWAVNQAAQPIVQQIVCDSAKYYVEKVMNQMFQLIPMTSAIVQDGAQVGFPIYPKNLTLSYLLMADTQVGNYFMTTSHRGEISPNAIPAAPFYPAALQTGQNSGRMLDAWAGDYVINSMLYHAHKMRVLDMTLNEVQTPQFVDSLKTQCIGTTVDCLGNTLPELALSYPSQIAEMVLTPTQMPYVLFVNGKGKLYSDSTLYLNLKTQSGAPDTPLVAAAHLEADLNLSLNDLTLQGSVKTTKLEFTVKQSTLGPATQTRMNALSSLTSMFIDRVLNEKLQAGYTLLNSEAVKLLNPNLRLLDRTMVFDSDVEFQYDYLLQMAVQARQKVEASSSVAWGSGAGATQPNPFGGGNPFAGFSGFPGFG